MLDLNEGTLTELIFHAFAVDRNKCRNYDSVEANQQIQSSNSQRLNANAIRIHNTCDDVTG